MFDVRGWTALLAALPLLAAQAEVDEYAGVYETEDGRRVLVAPSARSGHALFGVDDYAFSRVNVLGHVPPGEWQNDERLRSMRRIEPAPYDIRPVTFESDVPLAGTLFVPKAEAPVPGVVMIHGSGVSDRDNLWYVLIARAMVENGIAVLLPDKRGSGQSGGDWRTASFATLADDALAATAVLRAMPEIDTALIGLVGLSQGGWVAPLAASRSTDVAFAVTVVSSAVTPREQVRFEIRNQVHDAGVPRWLAPVVMPFVRGRPMRRQPEWWDLNGDYDPLPLWRTLEIPILAILGADDDNVPAARSAELLRSLDRPALTEVLVIPGVGHSLVDSNGELHPAFWTRLVSWIQAMPREGG